MSEKTKAALEAAHEALTDAALRVAKQAQEMVDMTDPDVNQRPEEVMVDRNEWNYLVEECKAWKAASNAYLAALFEDHRDETGKDLDVCEECGAPFFPHVRGMGGDFHEVTCSLHSNKIQKLKPRS